MNRMTRPAGTLACLAAVLALAAASVGAAEKPRLVVLTDIGGDPDDTMSVVRLMAYANHIDIEGLVATPTGRRRAEVAPERIQNDFAARMDWTIAEIFPAGEGRPVVALPSGRYESRFPAGGVGHAAAGGATKRRASEGR